MEQLPVAAVGEALGREGRVWVRLAAERGSGAWVLRLFEITTAEAPPSWKPVQWRYPDALFLASPRAGKTVAGWFRRQRIAVKGATIPLEFHDLAACERRESRWEGRGFEPLRWPHQECRLTAGRADVPGVELVAEGAPSFVSFDVASAALLGVRYTGWSVSGREYVIRRQDTSARIVSYENAAAELTVEVDGEALGGTVIELAGYTPGPARQLSSRSRRVRFALADGLPEGSWLVLRRGDEWLDQCFLSWPYLRGSSPPVADGSVATDGLPPATDIRVEAGQPLSRDLATSAQAFARSALRAAADKDSAIFFLHAGTGLEHLSKAVLVSLHGSLIARDRDFDSLLHLTGQSKHAATKPSQVRTITLDAAVKRAAQIVPELGALTRDLEPLIEARNGVAHFGLVPREDVEASIVSFLNASELLLQALGIDRTEFWGDLVDVVDAREAASADESRTTALEKVAVARISFKTRVGDLADDAREALLHAIVAGYAPAKYTQTLVGCPACGTPALVEGTIDVEWEPDWEYDDGEAYAVGAYPEVHIFPQRLECRACELRLRGRAELAAAEVPASWKLEDIDPDDFNVPVEEGWLEV